MNYVYGIIITELSCYVKTMYTDVFTILNKKLIASSGFSTD